MQTRVCSLSWFVHVNHQDNLDSLDPRSDLRFGFIRSSHGLLLKLRENDLTNFFRQQNPSVQTRPWGHTVPMDSVCLHVSGVSWHPRLQERVHPADNVRALRAGQSCPDRAEGLSEQIWLGSEAGLTPLSETSLPPDARPGKRGFQQSRA